MIDFRAAHILAWMLVICLVAPFLGYGPELWAAPGASDAGAIPLNAVQGQDTPGPNGDGNGKGDGKGQEADEGGFVPGEPSTWMLLATGLLALWIFHRRTRPAPAAPVRAGVGAGVGTTAEPGVEPGVGS